MLMDGWKLKTKEHRVIGCSATRAASHWCHNPKSNDVMASWQESTKSYGDGGWTRLTCGLVTIVDAYSDHSELR